MSTLRVNELTGLNSSAVNIETGFTVPANRTAQLGDFLKSDGNCTAASFSGNGSGLTNVPGIDNTTVVGYLIVT